MMKTKNISEKKSFRTAPRVLEDDELSAVSGASGRKSGAGGGAKPVRYFEYQLKEVLITSI
jgi:hypothetical protein